MIDEKQKHLDEARKHARFLLATQSCTEDSLTAAIYEFAQLAVQDFATRIADALHEEANMDLELCVECEEKFEKLGKPKVLEELHSVLGQEEDNE